MNPWTRVNLLLGALAAVLLAIEFWPSPTPAGATLTDLAPEAISAIRIERADRLELALERHEDGWRLVYPQQGETRPRRVQQLLAVARAPVRRSYPVRRGLARYGLDEPAAILQLDGARLAFGDRDPSQRLRYVLVEDQVRVIDDVYFNLLTLPARHYGAD